MQDLPTKNNIRFNFTDHDLGTENPVLKTHINAQKKLKTGTTTVGCKIKNGVILAADRRATMGLFIASKNAQKIQKIQDYMYITIAGGVADAQYLVDVLRAETNLYNMQNAHPISIGQTAKLLQNICHNDKGNYEVGHILGGYIEREGPKIYDIEGYGSVLDEDYTSIGSGSLFAIGILETEWKPDLSIEDGIILCVKAVRSAIIRDVASGNGIDLVVIHKDQTIEKKYEINDPELINFTIKGK